MSTPYRGLRGLDMLKSHKIPAPTHAVESMITSGKPKLTGLKVLVIDDSKTIRRTAETLHQGGLRSVHGRRWFRCPFEDRRPPAGYRVRRHHDASPRRIPDLFLDQAQQGIQTD